MKRLFLVFSLISILLFSCSKSQFSVSNMRLGSGEEGYFVSVVLDEGDVEDKYSFILTSPDKDLVWKGDLSLDRGKLTSDILSVTPGASMPEGEYTLVIHSTNGSDVSVKVRL